MKLKENLISLTPQTRLYGVTRPIVAITGGIATGKSSVCQMLKAKGLKIIDADQLIHQIYQRPVTIDLVNQLAPQVLTSTRAIDFPKLRQLFFTNPKIKQELLAYLYPCMESEFLAAASAITQDVLIYDVPLLFERKLEGLVDFVICVYCPRGLQTKRLAQRDGSDATLIESILKQQLDIEYKRQHAHYVLDNSGDLAQLQHHIDKLLTYAFN